MSRESCTDDGLLSASDGMAADLPWASEEDTPWATAHDRMPLAMQQLYGLLGQIAKTSLSILLLGETGSGKEVIAGWVHAHSARAARPFIRINCAGLTDSLVESELFGHERGAFTGALGTHRGVFEVADGGTLFLDEIAELPLRTQAKLLRVLESGEFARVGSTQLRRVDVRILAATHRDLQQLVALGQFRQDLYFRLNAMIAAIPPLRERRTEIGPLSRLFLRRWAAREHRPLLQLHALAVAALERYDWPGNIRELRNTLERSAAICAGPVIGPELLELGARAVVPCHNAANGGAPSVEPRVGDVRRSLRDYERAQILAALCESGGNQTRAAACLGFSRRTLTNKLNAYRIDRPRKRASVISEAEG